MIVKVLFVPTGHYHWHDTATWAGDSLENYSW